MKCSLCGITKNEDDTSIKNYKCKKCANREAHKYYLKNKEKLKKRTRLWKKNNKEKVIKESQRYRKELKIKALKAYSKNDNIQCVCCGEKEIDFLCLDHIDNNGAQERKRKKYGLGTSFLKWLKVNNYPKNLRLQTMCLNCNMSKRIHGGVCVHQLRKKK